MNKVVKVCINGMFYSIRLMEKPFLEFVFSHKKTSRVDNDCSSKSFYSLSLSKFSMGTSLGQSIDSNDAFDIQQLFRVQEANGVSN